MALKVTPEADSPSASSLFLPLTRKRRGSVGSVISQVDKETLSNALDSIHTAASRSGTLTTFNEYTSPPVSAAHDQKGITGDLQGSLSGLYSRIRNTVSTPRDTTWTLDDGSEAKPERSSASRSPNAEVKLQPRRPQTWNDGASIDAPRSAQHHATHHAKPESFRPRSGPSVDSQSRSDPKLKQPDEPKNANLAASGPSRNAAPSLIKTPLDLTGKSSTSVASSAVAPVNVSATKPTAGDRNSVNQPDNPKTMDKDGTDPQKDTLTPSRISVDNTAPASAGVVPEQLSRNASREASRSRTGSVASEDSLPSPSPIHGPKSAKAGVAINSLDRVPPVLNQQSRHTLDIDAMHRSLAGLKLPVPTSDVGGTSIASSRPSASIDPDQSDEEQEAVGRIVPQGQANLKAEDAPRGMSVVLSQIKKRVLSKEYWMRDENAKDCFYCGDSFSTFRRKHHCRTCGQIFDAKCTSLVSGLPFGQSGTIRVCKPCEGIIDGYDDSSEYSEEEITPGIPMGRARHGSSGHPELSPTRSVASGKTGSHLKDDSLLTMAIPATRRLKDEAKRRPAVLEIDAEPRLARPGSSRSLKSGSGLRPHSSIHKRHHSRSLLQRAMKGSEDAAPFLGTSSDDPSQGKKLPAFHSDNVIDPELAAYLSDEHSSGDEQASIISTMMGDGLRAGEPDKNALSGFFAPVRKTRSRLGGKSFSGITADRDPDTFSLSSSKAILPRPSRRRNLSTSSNTHYGSPRLQRLSAPYPLPHTTLHESISQTDLRDETPEANIKRSSTMRGTEAPAVELNKASTQHVAKLLTQLLMDSKIPNVSSWERALMPILLQAVDDVTPNVQNGDDMDIRHYVKFKKVPGGRPGDTSYVSGLVFTKNLALKSMSRKISYPSILILTFPIEYTRHKQQYMPLDLLIRQEREYLQNLVHRIAALKPQILFCEHNIARLALEFLDQARIAVAANVKPSVLEAISRCSQTRIINSIDKLALKPAQAGRCASFYLQTYVHAGRRKTLMYLSGCPKDLGCTIVLRGAESHILKEIKRIGEFMLFVVYNLKLETYFLRDEFALIPSYTGVGTVQSSQDKTGVADSTKEKRSIIARSRDAARNVNSNILTNSAEENSTTKAEGQNPSTDAPAPDERPLPEHAPLPTFWSEDIERHKNKILSSSPCVRYMQPYLLMRAREQEVRLKFLKGLLEQSAEEENQGDEKPRKFSLITEEMIHESFKGASQKVREVLRAVQEAEYDKAVHNYQTQKKQWETYIGANSKLFDPFTHQNIAVLYSVVCTATSVPCSGPDTIALGFYNEHETSQDFEADCTLGQYVEDLCIGSGSICGVNGCERRMFEHHRQYVHGHAQLSVTVEAYPCKLPGYEQIILMWSSCRICGAETQVLPMSDNTWKYSFGKYLELSFWGHDLRPRTSICGHDLHKNFRRLFGFKNVAVRIQYDPVTLLEIIVPRTRITWKVTNDLEFKNEVFRKAEERINRFMVSVKARVGGIRLDTILPDKTEAGREEIERLTKKAEDEHRALVAKLQEKYMGSKYYEVIPLNRALRATQEKVAEWDMAFTKFDRNFFPSEKDITRLATLQLKRILFDRDDSVTSLASTDEASSNVSEVDYNEKVSSEEPVVLSPSTRNMSPEKTHHVLNSVIENHVGSPKPDVTRAEVRDDAETPRPTQPSPFAPPPPADPIRAAQEDQDVQHLDLAIPSEPGTKETSPEASQPASPALTRQSTKNSSPTSRGPSPEMERKKSGVSQIPRRTFTAVATGHRAQSQPPDPRRTNGSNNSGESLANTASGAESSDVKDQASSTSSKGDRKLSERIGLAALKTSVQAHSMIPRSVGSRRKDTKVSNLAKHFEQLSREFEKERLRDRRQRAERNRQSRAFPTAASKPIIEIYRNVHEAVAERGPADEELSEASLSRDSIVATGAATGKDTGREGAADGAASATDGEDDAAIESRVESDGEETLEKVDEEKLLELPNFPEAQGILSPSEAQLDLKLDLPKHEKNSLMKTLTNFWAERSASGWQALDDPLRSLDHIFADSDIVIREDEPSSLIAFALDSDDYKAKLQSIHGKSAGTEDLLDKPYVDDLFLSTDEQMRIERSLLQSTGSHLKYQFQEGPARMLCKVFYAEQFDAVRRKCGVADRIVESLSRCMKWDSKGGKTKSVFLKTLDDRLVLKSLSQIETQAFLRFAPAYFQLMGEALFHELPSVIAKMLGFYQIIIKNPTTGVEFNWFLLVMENLFYDRAPTRIFDLKGSMRNRRIQSTGEQNEVLLDENMVDFIYESPLFAREHSKKLLRASVWNDTLFLSRQNVMDYSLMVAIDEKRKELVVGIIDCIRTYTWDKKLESWMKDRGKNRPTVTSPREYKNRFREAMGRYVLQAPTCWHQFHNQAPNFKITYHDTTVAESRVEEQQDLEAIRSQPQAANES